MKFNPYYYKARLFPTLLASLPLLVFVNAVIKPIYADSLKSIYSILPMITSLGLSAALVFLCVQINRFIAKEIFQKLFFSDDIHMPTTDYLLWNNSFYSVEIKTAIHKKIFTLFKIKLIDKVEESQDEMKARNLIVTAVSQIRNKLSKDELLLQHNIEYGFVRNFIGGSLLACFFSLVIFLFAFHQQNKALMSTGLILFIIYIIPVILSRLLIIRYGKYYAKILFEKFLGI